MEDQSEVWQELAEKLIGKCLTKLIEMGEVEFDQVAGQWYVEYKQQKLENKGFAGAATLDRENIPVMYLSPDLNLEGVIEVISHETVHLAQICKGVLVPDFGFMEWKGRVYQTLPHDHPDYFENQPWEKEARDIQPIIYKYLKSEVERIST